MLYPKDLITLLIFPGKELKEHGTESKKSYVIGNVKGTKDITAELESAPAPDRIFNGLFRLFYGSAQR